VSVVLTNPLVMGVWGLVVAGSMFLAMLPWFLGLLLTAPVIGHASWHAYRAAVGPERPAPPA
jgi:uncharacterized membrane protein